MALPAELRSELERFAGAVSIAANVISGAGTNIAPSGSVFEFLVWGGTTATSQVVFYNARDGEVGRGKRSWVEQYATTGQKPSTGQH